MGMVYPLASFNDSASLEILGFSESLFPGQGPEYGVVKGQERQAIGKGGETLRADLCLQPQSQSQHF